MPSLPAELEIGDDGEVIGADEGPACNRGALLTGMLWIGMRAGANHSGQVGIQP